MLHAAETTYNIILMIKKLIIKITLGLVILFLIYRASTSPNFLIPMDVNMEEMQEVFRPEVFGNLETVYSFGNYKNHVSYHDIDGRIRCRLVRFNEFKFIPEYSETVIVNGIEITNSIENYYGTNPTLTVFQRQFKSYTEKPKLRFDKMFKVFFKNETSETLDIYGQIQTFGLFDEKNECEIKFDFSSLTIARLTFFRKNGNYYIALFYGINGYELNESDTIIK